MDETMYAQCNFRCPKVGGGDYVAKRGDEVDIGKIKLHPKGGRIVAKIKERGYIGKEKPKAEKKAARIAPAPSSLRAGSRPTRRSSPSCPSPIVLRMTP